MFHVIFDRIVSKNEGSFWLFSIFCGIDLVIIKKHKKHDKNLFEFLLQPLDDCVSCSCHLINILNAVLLFFLLYSMSGLAGGIF